VKEWWKQAMRKEAVHLLMINKSIVSIQALKETRSEMFAKDELFE
jgi:hypothetical protein